MIFLILFLSLIFSIIQSSFLPNFDLVLIFVLFFSILGKKQDVFLISFFSGLFLDLAFFQPLGISSLLFLLFSFFVCFYKERFDSLHILFLPIFSFLATLAYSLATLKELDFKKALISLIAVVVFRFLIIYLDSGFKGKAIKLRS
jgi:rod shape-determining protein MreD